MKAYSGNEDFIFVSYRHKDYDRVLPILKELEKGGYRFWYDEALTSGGVFSNEILEKLGKSRVMMVFLSSNYIESDFCMNNELASAKMWGKEIVPVFLEPEGRFRLIQQSAAPLAYAMQKQGIKAYQMALGEIMDVINHTPSLAKCNEYAAMMEERKRKEGRKERSGNGREGVLQKNKMTKIIVVLAAIVAALGLALAAWLLFIKPPTVPDALPTAADRFQYSDTILSKEDVAAADRDTLLEANENYEVGYAHRKAQASYSEWCTIGNNHDLFYPGALVGLKDGNLHPLGTDLARAPITMSLGTKIVSQTGGDSLLQTVDPTLSETRRAIATLVNENLTGKGALSSFVSMEVHEVESVEEFYLNLGIGVETNSIPLADKFRPAAIQKQTNLVVVFRQTYFTVDCDYQGFDSLFKAHVTSPAIEAAFKDKTAAYVSSVAYGRVIMLSIQTNYSVDEVKAALSMGWNSSGMKFMAGSGFGDEVNFDINLQNIAKDKNTDISYFVYGGNGDDSVAMTSISYDGSKGKLLQNLLSQNIDLSDAKPVSCTLRNFDGSLASVKQEKEYLVKEVKYLPKRLMSWDSYIKIIEDGSIKELDSLTFDLTNLVNYKNPGQSTNVANITITVPENIKRLTLIGPNDTTKEIIYENLSIFVQNPLILELNNISFRAKDGEAAIYTAKQMHDFEVECKGRVSINGGSGAVGISVGGDAILRVYRDTAISGGNGTTGQDGAAGISCSGILTVEMKDYSALTVTGGDGGNGNENTTGSASASLLDGGNGGDGIVAKKISFIRRGEETVRDNAEIVIQGGNGGNGIAGTDGKNGETNNSVVWVRDVYNFANTKIQSISRYEDAYDGENGGDGGDGGDGGQPIVCDQINVGYVSIKLIYGDGGDGADAGNGGNGGNGHGYSGYVTGVSFIVAHDPGKGGDGGDGGDGGKAGISVRTEYSIDSSNVEIVVGKDGKAGECGKGGLAGKGGTGGSTSGMVNDHSAANAEDGKPGEDGGAVSILPSLGN